MVVGMPKIAYETLDEQIIEKDCDDIEWDEDLRLYRFASGEEILELPPGRPFEIRYGPDEDDKPKAGGTSVEM